MITNLADYFNPKQEVFLESIAYNRIDNPPASLRGNITLVGQENIQVSLNDNGVNIILTRSVKFEPTTLFELSVSLGANLQFNKKKDEIDWKALNLAEEFLQNGSFITVQLASRICLLIGQITSSYGLQPLLMPVTFEHKQS